MCWLLEVQTRQFTISDITYACGYNGGALTIKWWLVSPKSTVVGVGKQKTKRNKTTLQCKSCPKGATHVNVLKNQETKNRSIMLVSAPQIQMFRARMSFLIFWRSWNPIKLMVMVVFSERWWWVQVHVLFLLPNNNLTTQLYCWPIQGFCGFWGRCYIWAWELLCYTYEIPKPLAA